MPAGQGNFTARFWENEPNSRVGCYAMGGAASKPLALAPIGYQRKSRSRPNIYRQVLAEASLNSWMLVVSQGCHQKTSYLVGSTRPAGSAYGLLAATMNTKANHRDGGDHSALLWPTRACLLILPLGFTSACPLLASPSRTLVGVASRTAWHQPVQRSALFALVGTRPYAFKVPMVPPLIDRLPNQGRLPKSDGAGAGWGIVIQIALESSRTPRPSALWRK